MNGMKRLLSVVAILVIAASLLPVKGQAGYRGAFDPITSNDDNLIRGKFAPNFRGVPFSGAGTAASLKVERWMAFVTLSSVVGSESTGEIWLQRNVNFAAANGIALPVPMLRDENGIVSYIDPAWSKDGKWLAYVQTDNSVSAASIYVQQYDTSAATDGNVALGSPILVANGSGGVHHRHPAWNPAGTQIAYDSDAFGPSIDLWTVDISLDATAHTGTVNEASRTRHQLGLEVDQASQNILNGKAEFKAAYSPDGTKIAYVTNRYGAFQIQILTQTASGLGESVTPAETNPALVTHDNPSWGSPETGNVLFYDAPSNEDPANPQDIFKLDLNTGQKCNIFVDLAGDVDPNVSQYVNTTSDGIKFNLFTFISQAGGFGVQIWRGEYVQNCVPALPVTVQITPSQVDLNRAKDSDIYTATVRFPQSTVSAGFVCRAANAGGEGIRTRRSVIASPTLLGLTQPGYPVDPSYDCTTMGSEIAGEPGPTNCEDLFFNILGSTVYGWWVVYPDTIPGSVINDRMDFFWYRKTINARIVALGLVDKYVPLTWRAYTNRIGRQLLGFGYIKLSKNNLAATSIVLQQNYPNPFNPVTKVNFAVDKGGNVDVRVFNTRGELVRTITNQWYPQGEHTVSWDGKTQSGGHAPSGIYYIRARSAGGTDVIKAVLAK
jgi:hypothetical protein